MDFYKQQAIKIIERPGAMLQASKGLDQAIRTALASVISAVSIPAAYSGKKIASDIASWWMPSEYFLGLSNLYHLCCDVVLKTLAYHGERKHSKLSVSGLGYESGGIRQVNDAVVQMIHWWKFFRLT